MENGSIILPVTQDLSIGHIIYYTEKHNKNRGTFTSLWVFSCKIAAYFQNIFF